MKTRGNPLSVNPNTLLATLMATFVIVALIAACGGGEPEELAFDLEIKDRQLNIQVIEAKQDDAVTLNISTDEPGEFHLHGYDYEEDLSPGEVTVLVFEANATGRFNITFHPGGEHIEDEHEDDMDHPECDVTPVPGEPLPGISVTANPSDKPHHIDIVVTTANIVLSDDGDHWHLYVNGELDSMNVGPEVTFDTRNIGSPGEYQIMVTLNDLDHCDYGAQAMTTIVLEGEEPVDMEDMEEDHEDEEEEVLIGSLEVQPR